VLVFTHARARTHTHTHKHTLCRPVKRAVQRELETTLAKALLRGDFVEEDTVVVDAGVCVCVCI